MSDQAEGKIYTCPICHGVGRVEDGMGGWDDCTGCNEDGWVDAETYAILTEER